MKLTYYLDGQEMAPEDLKGKSGHLEIHVEYENNEKQNVTINGKEETIYSPFVMVTGDPSRAIHLKMSRLTTERLFRTATVRSSSALVCRECRRA